MQEFGIGPYYDSEEVVKGIDGKLIPVQGPNSKAMKFSKNICQKCNNERSQPFDKCYEDFTEYIRTNELEIIGSKQFRFSDIFLESWDQKRLNLLRYYVKHICCRLAENNIYIHQRIIDFLNGATELMYLNYNLEIRLDIVAMVIVLKKDNIGDGCLWLGSLDYLQSKSTGKKSDIRSFLGYRWLRMNYKYDYSLEHTNTNLSADKVVLPVGWNINPLEIISKKSN